MKIEEALNYADEWAKSQTFYEGMQGWRVVCAVLAAEVRRLQAEPDAVPLGYVAHDRKVGPRPGDCIITKEDAAEYHPECITAVYVRPPRQIDVGNMEYMGNSVAYIYQKMQGYRHQLGQAQVIDDETRNLVLKLRSMAIGEDYFGMIEIAKQLREKLGAGDE